MEVDEGGRRIVRASARAVDERVIEVVEEVDNGEEDNRGGKGGDEEDEDWSFMSRIRVRRKRRLS